MDKNHLRGIILKLQDRLSDDDRKRLHFFLGNEVPRPIRDDSTLNGTLSLMESLFDQDKISEENFTFLITAFDEIQCTDAVKILKEHKQRMQSNLMYKSTHSLATIMPSLIDEILTDQDKYKSSSSSFFINQENKYSGTNKIINTIKTNINPVTITIDNKEKFCESFEKHQTSYTSFRMNKYFFLMVLSLFIGSGTLMGILILKSKQTARLTDDINKKDNTILQEQRTKNELIQQVNNLTAENNKTKQSNNQLISPEKDKDNLLVIAGRQYGGTGGDYFDDSLYPGFTCLHYVNGIVIRDNNNDLESYQFLYSPSRNDQSRIESHNHGDQTSKVIDKFKFDKNDKIKKVNFSLIHENWISPNGTNLTRTIITGIRFESEDGITSPLYHDQLGEPLSEEFPGYTLGYNTGRSAQYIEQLQFFWYRTQNTIFNK